MKKILFFLLMLGAYCHLEAQTIPPPPAAPSVPSSSDIIPIHSDDGPKLPSSDYNLPYQAIENDSTIPPSVTISPRSSSFPTFSWNLSGTSLTSPLQSVQETDSKGNYTLWSYNNGTPTSVLRVTNSASEVWNYNTNGEVTSYQDPSGKIFPASVSIQSRPNFIITAPSGVTIHGMDKP